MKRSAILLFSLLTILLLRCSVANDTSESLPPMKEIKRVQINTSHIDTVLYHYGFIHEGLAEENEVKLVLTKNGEIELQRISILRFDDVVYGIYVDRAYGQYELSNDTINTLVWKRQTLEQKQSSTIPTYDEMCWYYGSQEEESSFFPIPSFFNIHDFRYSGLDSNWIEKFNTLPICN